MLLREKGERKFQKQKMVAERERKEIKACAEGEGRKEGSETNDGRSEEEERAEGMLQREKEERKFQKQMLVAERKRKEMKACCRRRREKGSFRNKGRSLRRKMR